MTRMPAMCMIVLAGAAIAIADAARPLASASLPATSYPAWDGRETQAQYARRAGIKDAQLALQLDAASAAGL